MRVMTQKQIKRAAKGIEAEPVIAESVRGNAKESNMLDGWRLSGMWLSSLMGILKLTF